MAKNDKRNKKYTNLYVKRKLMKLEIDVFGIIANGLLHHTPKQKILQQIKKEIQILAVHIGLSDAEIQQVWGSCYAKYLELSKKTTLSLVRIERKFGKKEDYEESLKQRRTVIYNSIRAKIMRNDLVKEANELMYQYEYREKHDNLFGPEGIIATARDVEPNSYSPFFLCSSHPKPAKDHAAWEGKMYYDEDWEKYVADELTRDQCRAYIRNHRLHTLQWVVGAPVYLTTRRNCKHYMMNIPLDEVLHSSAKALVKKHKMYMANEEPVSNDVRNYREYYNRLKVEQALYELVPNEILAKDITKDKKLLDKWKNLINNNNAK